MHAQCTVGIVATDRPRPIKYWVHAHGESDVQANEADDPIRSSILVVGPFREEKSTDETGRISNARG